jgi:Cysteine rich repeat
MRQFLLIVAVVPMTVLASAASAQQQPGQDACARDVSRHCRKVMNDGDQAVLACLKENRSKISKGCEKVLTDHGQ